MNTIQVQPKAAIQSIKLIDGTFTASEAGDILHTILDKKINFHKLQTIRTFEQDHEDPCQRDNGRLAELQQEKDRLCELLTKVRASGKRLNISSTISIELV